MSLGLLLDAVVDYVSRYVVVTPEQVTVIALWVLHTHTVDSHGVTPYLWITSAEKASGKTTLLETLEHVVARPWLTASVSAPTLARKIDQDRPTLLLDESDATFKGNREFAEALRGVLNTGFRASGTYSRCVGTSGTNLQVADFKTFCPKAIAGIGRLPDTVVSRSIPIRLRRKTGSEPVERFRRRTVESEGAALRAEIEAWAEEDIDRLADQTVALIVQLSDRAFDVWEPLLAIAGLAGGDWPERAHAAALALSGLVATDDESFGVRLLADIRSILADRDRVLSAELTYALNAAEESPWGGFNTGTGIKPREIAKLLKPFEIAPHTIRDSDRNAKGYYAKSFEDAFDRYLPNDSEPPAKTVTPSQTASPSEEPPPSSRHTDPAVTEAENGAEPHHDSDVTVVTAASERDGDPEARLPDDDEIERLAARAREWERRDGRAT
jgi:hypothetical protein